MGTKIGFVSLKRMLLIEKIFMKMSDRFLDEAYSTNRRFSERRNNCFLKRIVQLNVLRAYFD